MATDDKDPKTTDATFAVTAVKPKKKASLAMRPSTHVHDDSCDHGDHSGHDHSGHDHDDHSGHEHSGHDHSGHDHSGHDHSGHDHSGHDHSGHDHSGHDHGHDHDHEHAHAPRPAEQRPCAISTSKATVQVDLHDLLPGERDHHGRFAMLVQQLMQVPGIEAAHLRDDGACLECCVHHDGARGFDDVVTDVRARGNDVEARTLMRSWFVRGMTSPQSSMLLEDVLRQTRGVLQADVAPGAERLVVEFERAVVDEDALVKAAEKTGVTLEPVSAGHVCAHHQHNSGGLAPKLELPLVVLSGVLLVAGVVVERAGLAPAMISNALFGGALLSGGFFATRAAVLALLEKKVDIETLMVLAAVGAACLGAFFEGAFLLFLFSLGHMLEHRAMDRARHAMEALEKLRPDTARVKRASGDVEEVAIDAVRKGDIVVVRPGDRIPLDGTVVDGASDVDQAALTGESVPVPKQAGSDVFAGTVVKDGSLEFKVTKRASESSLARLVDLVAEAEARKSGAQRFARKAERIFVPLVLVGAPLLVLVLWSMGTPVREAVLRGLSLLVAASPCALAVSSPAAVLSAVARAAKAGVLIKGGAHLEGLARVTVVALDKTGTLTEGTPKLVDIQTTSGLSQDDVLAAAAAAETLSSHPIALAIVKAAAEKKLPLAKAEDARAVHGKGLSATVWIADQPTLVRIGNAGLFDNLSAEVKSSDLVLQTAGKTTMIVEIGGVIAGVFGVLDTARPQAKKAIEALKKAGIHKTIMISGDARPVANAIAASTGVDEVRAPCLPEDKVKVVHELKQGGVHVAMVGDGVNDAPALANADVGVAMGGAGSDVALETADVVLMGDDLMALAFAVRLSRAATAAVTQNLTIALGVASVLIVASIVGAVAVSQAVVLHEGSTLVVVANGLRLLWFERTRT